MGVKFSVQNKPLSNMASFLIFVLASFFADERKSIDCSKHHVKSNYVHSLTYAAGILGVNVNTGSEINFFTQMSTSDWILFFSRHMEKYGRQKVLK